MACELLGILFCTHFIINNSCHYRLDWSYKIINIIFYLSVAIEPSLKLMYQWHMCLVKITYCVTLGWRWTLGCPTLHLLHQMFRFSLYKGNPKKIQRKMFQKSFLIIPFQTFFVSKIGSMMTHITFWFLNKQMELSI